MMDAGYQRIAVEAGKLAAEAPFALLTSLACAVEACDPSDWPSARSCILHGVAHPHYRCLSAAFLDCWRGQVASLAPQAVALALLTAAHSEKAHRDHQSVELVWTGPETGAVPFRRTEQAILQVLDSARERITLVSYAVYRIANICEALVQAARRGVRIRVIVETPDKLEGEKEYGTLRALGDDVAACSTVYYWPKDQRGRDGNGKLGILHVKCAVADGRWLFLSSANLTEYAFTINMELGVLVTGGALPDQVQEHFDRLIAGAILCRA
jgi:phosphatidylserine/phosphatidylglycerophosphate/cardiolipin synthase-like enzyme